MNLCELLKVDEAHLVQKVKNYDGKKIKFPCIVQEKYDGVYCIAIWRDGKVHIFSRTGKEYVSLNHLKEELDIFMCEANRPLVIFEAYAYGVDQPTISGWCRDEQNQHPEIVAIVHDCLTMGEYYGIAKTSYRDRYCDREILCSYDYLIFPDCIEVNDAICIFELATQVWQEGGEGVIIKNPDAPYARGKRNYDLMKLKQSVTYDLEVIGVEEGQGKYEGIAGTLVLRWKNGQSIRVGSGLTDAERKAFWEDKDSIIGKIVEVKAMKESTEGVLREPRYKGIRYDKAEADV